MPAVRRVRGSHWPSVSRSGWSSRNGTFDRSSHLNLGDYPGHCCYESSSTSSANQPRRTSPMPAPTGSHGGPRCSHATSPPTSKPGSLPPRAELAPFRRHLDAAVVSRAKEVGCREWAKRTPIDRCCAKVRSSSQARFGASIALRPNQVSAPSPATLPFANLSTGDARSTSGRARAPRTLGSPGALRRRAPSDPVTWNPT